MTLAVLVAISLGVVGMSAFEAHVINITAQIENGLTVPLEANGMSFGTVFPEEVAYQNMGIELSSSFLTTDRVDDIEYMIRQKPKCGVPAVPATNPVSYTSFPQVTENADGAFICPQGSVMLPLLCPYLSKTELDANGATTTNAIPAFHGPLVGWTMADTLATQLRGRLSKADKKTSATWQLDLHAPCFKGMCAQDNVIPAAYEADPAYEHQMFGCDLWVEVAGVSLPGEKGTLIVNKVLSPTDDPGKFNLQIDGVTVATDQGNGGTTGAQVVSAGIHSVGEVAGTGTSLADYTAVIGGDADCADGSVTVPASGTVTCTITNTFIVQPPDTGQLTVNKQVQGNGADPNSFPLFVDGMSVTNGVATTTSAGSHTVIETENLDYNMSFGSDCPGGIVTVSTSTPATCTVTNTLKDGNLTVTKIVEGGTKTVADFPLFVDGMTVTSGVATTTSAGSHTVTETTDPDYTESFGADCPGGVVNVPANGSATCTVTNTRKTGKITVHKVVTNHIDGTTTGTSSFQMMIDGGDVAQDTQITVTANQAHTISETGPAGYDTTFSGACNGNNQVTVAPGEEATCTVTNEQQFGTITVIKSVVNDDGGALEVPDFTLKVDSSVVTSGTPKNVALGTHTVSENGKFGYQATIGGNCSLSGSITIAAGESKTCTIENDDIRPSIELIKVVNGGSAEPDDFDLSIDDAIVTSGSSNPVVANTAHVIDEETLVSGYSFTSITGTSFKGVSCPAALNGTITLVPGDVVTCTITNTQ